MDFIFEFLFEYTNCLFKIKISVQLLTIKY